MIREKESRFIKCDKPARGASGDIGFARKASNTNGLRAVKQQYLRKKLNSTCAFRGRFNHGASFFLPKAGQESLH